MGTVGVEAAGGDERPLLARVLRPFQEFVESEALGGVLLFGSTIVALIWANSPWCDAYTALWKLPISVGPANAPLTLSLHHWVDDGLMAIFFLLVGLEIKRELLVGELASPRQAALPVAGALGGVLLPALLYALVNWDGAGARGWGIPMATDIAFALAIVRALGSRVPYGLTMFLAALAIVDDLVAVLVIAVFYTVSVEMQALGLAAAIMAVLVVLNRAGVRALGPYLALGVMLWLAVLASGVHATIAGVLLALTIPVETPLDAVRFSADARALLDDFDRGETGDARVLTSAEQQESLHALHVAARRVNPPLLRLEHALHRPVAVAVLPLFALANAGVGLSGLGDTLVSPVAGGIELGLVVGKPAGITLASWLAVKLGLAALPADVTWLRLHGAAWLAGIGFTMALFIATLSFGESPMLETAKAGILAGSVVAGMIGWTILRRTAG